MILSNGSITNIYTATDANDTSEHKIPFSPALEHPAPSPMQRANVREHFGQPTAVAAAASFLVYKVQMPGSSRCLDAAVPEED